MPMMIPIAMAVGTAVSAYGAYQQGQAAKKAANYNATVQQQNAQIAMSQSQAQAGQIQRENVLRAGMIRANAGASGGTPDGSALDVIGDVAAQGELEKQDALYRGQLEARGFTNTANLDTYQGKYAARAGLTTAGSELLKGGAATYDTYRRIKRGG